MTSDQASLPKIKEDLLYYVWSLKRFDHHNLRTSEGLILEIINTGHRNEHSGPDFHQAKIKIGDQLWAGHVEMHVRASDWLKHNHQDDPAFQNVILHVVYENDKLINLPNGEPLPCLELGGRITEKVMDTYTELLSSKAWIPCASNHRPISDLALYAWYERILVERLKRKTDQISEQLELTNNDWEEVFYRFLARNFGFKINADVFEALAHSLPRKIINKHKDRLREIEALLFGQAGFLASQYEDEYAHKLADLYSFLKKKYRLRALDQHLWKFMRMRPANFPTVRIAQFAVLIFKSSHLFSKMLAASNYKEIKFLFSSEVSSYWRKHYQFDKTTTTKSKKLGKSSIDLIVINTVVPFLFHYGQVNRQEKFKQKALKFLQEINAEKNRVTRGFQDLGFRLDSAFDSQALIQLKADYCDKKQCLSCAIGNSIFSSNTDRNP